MSLLCDIAQVLPGKECTEVRADLGDMVVDEFIQLRSAPLTTILLCESPHVEEVRHGHALAGRTGKTVTGILRHILNTDENTPTIDSQCAIGRLLAGSVQHPVLNTLGLMNVSRLPLQETPYCERILSDGDYGCLLQNFETMRNLAQKKGHGIGFRSPAIRRISMIVLRDLKRRLCQLPNGVLVIPCGNVATNFLNRAEGECRRQWSCQSPTVSHPIRWPREDTPWRCLPGCIRELLCLIRTRAQS